MEDKERAPEFDMTPYLMSLPLMERSELEAEAASHTAPEGTTGAPKEKVHPRRAPKTTRYKNITRIDHAPKRTHGYFVRVQWKGERRVKFFSDRRHGDRLGALAAALEWREQVEKELGKPRSERQVVGKTRNTSGIIGVRRVMDRGVPAYEASWIEGHKVRRTKFSVRKYGERQAKALAVKLRRQKESERLRSPRGKDD